MAATGSELRTADVLPISRNVKTSASDGYLLRRLEDHASCTDGIAHP